MGMFSSIAGPEARPKDAQDASRQLEALVLKQLLMASGTFKGTDLAGSSIRADLFAEALADAVTKAGGLGLAAQLDGSLPKPTSPAALPGSGATPRAIPQEGGLSAAPRGTPELVGGSSRITSGFGVRPDPFDGHAELHSGVDVGAAEGTPILAASDGLVRRAGPRGGYGFAVEIDHGGGVTTLYGHARELLVEAGETVKKGQAIAKVGHTGSATGAHLHFELRREGRPVDPAQVLKAYGARDEG
jgi:murein DD-endopeptidase MepM/ murein hydrolase activator NlpD